MVAIFWLLFAVACGDRCPHEGHCDASSMVQLKADKQLPCDNWKLGFGGESCDQTCGDGLCTDDSRNRQSDLTIPQVIQLSNDCFNVTVVPEGGAGTSAQSWWPGVFYQRRNDYGGMIVPNRYEEQQRRSSCNTAKPNTTINFGRRLCYCQPSAPVTGDPHIVTLRGDHYTLLKSGTFLAWSFQDAVTTSGPGENQWRLLASYSGARFTTAALLLEGPVGVMELTAQDCQWRQKEAAQWHNVTLGDHGGYVEVLDLNRTVKGHLPIGSKMFLKKVQDFEHKKVAKLVTHCRPGLRLDFMVSIYDQDDLQHMGGELGAPKHRTENQVHFLSSQYKVSTQTDSEFEVPTPWLTLGGSEEADAYLKARMATTPINLLETNADCSEAEQICSKHMPKESEAFGDCIFDVCNGDEADAEAAAEMLAETQ